MSEETAGVGARPGARLAGTFHARLRAVWAQWELENDRRLLPDELASWLAERGYEVTAGHLRRLRSQTDTQPSLRLIEGLAEFFDVDSGLLLTEQRARQTLADAMQDAGVEGIALRATGLSAANLEAITRLLDTLRAGENLPAVPPDAPR